jgi:hypothetical protein
MYKVRFCESWRTENYQQTAQNKNQLIKIKTFWPSLHKQGLLRFQLISKFSNDYRASNIFRKQMKLLASKIIHPSRRKIFGLQVVIGTNFCPFWYRNCSDTKI